MKPFGLAMVMIFRGDQKANRFPGFAVLNVDRIGLGEKEQQSIVIKCNNCSRSEERGRGHGVPQFPQGLTPTMGPGSLTSSLAIRRPSY